MADLAAIIDRLEKANGPDRELDLDIAIAIGILPTEVNGYGPYLRRVECRRVDPFTDSLEAVIALVERMLPGVWYLIAKGKLTAEEPLYGANLLFGPDETIGEGEHNASAALALLIAFSVPSKLRSRRNDDRRTEASADSLDYAYRRRLVSDPTERLLQARGPRTP